MRLLAIALSLLVVALHVAFAVAEMFYWQHPAVMARFGNTPEFAKATTVLAGNIGIYNAVFAAAVAWAALTWNRSMLLVMLAGIVVAGVYGGLTAKFAIIVVQALPALLAFAATWVAGRPSAA
jgi:putative membrane protein